MKNIFIIILSLSLLSTAFACNVDRAEFRQVHPSEARQSLSYDPAITQDIFRDLAVTQYRQLRNNDYKPSKRVTDNVVARALSASKPQGHKDMTFAEVSNAIWAQVESENPQLFLLDERAIKHTFIWYKLQEYNSSSNLQKQKKIQEISTYLK